MKENQFHKIPRHVTDIILQNISDGVFTVDHKWRITSFNRAAEMITGIKRDEALEKYCWEVFRSNMCETHCALRRTMKQGKPFVDTSTYFINSDKRCIPVVVSTSLLKDKDGTVLGGVETFRDMSMVEELRKKLDGRFQIGDMVSRSQSMHKIFTILPQHLPDAFISQPLRSIEHDKLEDKLKSAEARVIIDALKRNNFNRLASARDLGLHKSTLFRKIKKLGVKLPKFDGRSASL